MNPIISSHLRSLSQVVSSVTLAAALVAAQANTKAFAQTETSAALSKLKDLIIYSDPTFYAAFPSVVVKPDGEMLCAFRRAPNRKFLYGAPGYTHQDPNSYLVQVRSRDGGETWTTSPELIFAHPLGGSQDPCMIQMRDGAILCASYGWALLPPETDKESTRSRDRRAFQFLGGYLLRSQDGGDSWTGPIIPPDIAQQLPGAKPRPTYNRGAMAQAETGELLWAAVSQDLTKPRQPTSVHLMTSNDKGDSWKRMAPIAVDEKISFNETSLIVTKSGAIVAFVRTETKDHPAVMARSEDGGRTFSKWEELGFSGVPFQAIRLPDDRILLVYGYRKKPFGIRAKLLNAEATDAKSAPEFIIRDDGGTHDIGYPWATLLPDGDVLVAYYFNKDDGPRHIAGSVLQVK